MTPYIQRAVKRRLSDEEYIGETKTDGSDRIIEVDAEVMKHLRNHRQFTQLEGTFIFKPEELKRLSDFQERVVGIKRRTHINKDRYGLNTLKGMLSAALKRAGVSLTNRSPKQIRHTYTSLMLSEGMNPMQVAAVMGHKNPDFTMQVYQRYIKDNNPNAGSLLESFFSDLEEDKTKMV